MISTKGRYALRVMVDLAEQDAESYIPLKEIVARQELSLKYLETIMTMLSKEGLIAAAHGKGGGYKLLKKPDEYTVGNILKVTEKSVIPSACAECVGEDCPRKDDCRTLAFWEKLNGVVSECLNGTTLADLMKNDK